MRSFKDSAGRQWEIKITVGSLRAVKDSLKLNLADLNDGEPPLVLRLDADTSLLFSVIWELVKGQASPLGVSQSQFETAFDSQTVGEAAKAFWGEMADFFQNLRPVQSLIIQDVIQILSAAKSGNSAMN